jgi:hypothetical protein
MIKRTCNKCYALRINWKKEKYYCCLGYAIEEDNKRNQIVIEGKNVKFIMTRPLEKCPKPNFVKYFKIKTVGLMNDNDMGI